MFHKQDQFTPAHISGILQAAEAAARAIPPAFPLDATVAVNPFLGQTSEDLASASARLARAAGVRVTRERADYARAVADGAITDEDLTAALAASPHASKPADLSALHRQLAADSPAPRALPTVAHLAVTATGTDWPALIDRCFGLWAAGYFDRGQALWTPAPGHSAFAGWREWATHDLTPEIAGLTGFCAHVASAPDTPERAILRAADRLGLGTDVAESVFHRLLMDIGGWSQHARWLLWQAELAGATDSTITDLLAIRLVWEEALLNHAPQAEKPWVQTRAAHAAPLAPSPAQVVDAVLQDAAERAYQRGLAAAMTGLEASEDRPEVQAAFCIDVRSEVFRRAFEAQSPAIDTIGFAGFFGLPLAHRPHGTDQTQLHLPALLNPALTACSHKSPKAEEDARIAARAARAWGRFRQAAVSSFAFVESAGPIYGWKLVKGALGLEGTKAAKSPAPLIEGGLTPDQKAEIGAKVLTAMSMTKDHAPLVLLLGHGASVTNNPHESAYHCGACAGQTGEVSARMLAILLNDPDTRAGLPQHGITVAEDVLFVAGLHDTTTDEVALFDDCPAPGHKDRLAQARRWLKAAGAQARSERALRLPGATAQSVTARALDWAEVRPEWGLAGCAAFIAASRNVTRRADLQGRAFLHSYDWQDDAGFATLELILTAPVVVASWISLQYYGSSVAPLAFGGGNKLIHNVVGGIGVVQGNGGVLRCGLPWQSVHDGAALAHDPLRLSVMIEAPSQAISDILEKHPGVQALFDNGWLHLLALDGGRVVARYRPGLIWEQAAAQAQAA